MSLFKRDESAMPQPFDGVRENQRPRKNPKEEITVSLKTDDITTILGKGSEFEGKLQFEGTLQIEGVFSGEIHSDSVLVVGEGAKVSAEVNIGTIVVNGEVKGNIRAKNGVEIRKPGRILGNIQTPSLIIEQGVVFEGSCKMENLGTKTAPPVFPPHEADKKGKEKDLVKDKI